MSSRQCRSAAHLAVLLPLRYPTDEQVAAGTIFPALEEIREVSAVVAVAVIKQVSRARRAKETINPVHSTRMHVSLVPHSPECW